MRTSIPFQPLLLSVLLGFAAPAWAADFDVTGNASGTTSSLTLSAALTTSSQHVGQRGEIYVAARMGNVWYFNSQGNWGTALAPYRSGTLEASATLPVVSAMNLSAFNGLEIYVGYGTSATEMVGAGRYKKIYTVSTGTPYIQGSLAGQSASFIEASNSAAKATGALMQAILAVNSVLYTDPAVSDVSTLRERKTAADTALAVLEKYALESETTLGTGSVAENAFSALSPEEVLATVAAGNSKTQLKTLMAKYKVGAKEAKTILDNAMSGLISQYNADAKYYDTAARTAQLVKEGSGLALTIVGTAVTAGGVAGAVGIGEAALTLISGADAAIKVSKAGVELLKGADIPTPGGTAGAIMTTLSDASELIAITNLRKWTEPADIISNWVTLEQKRADALYGGEVNLGSHTYTISPLTQERLAQVDSVLRPAAGAIPATMTGKYKVNGTTVEVKTLPQVVKDTIAMLPDADRVPEVVNKAPAGGYTFLDSLELSYTLTPQFTATCTTSALSTLTGTGSYKAITDAYSYGISNPGSPGSKIQISDSKRMCYATISGSNMELTCTSSVAKFTATVPANGTGTVATTSATYTLGYSAAIKGACTVPAPGTVTVTSKAH